MGIMLKGWPVLGSQVRMLDSVWWELRSKEQQDQESIHRTHVANYATWREQQEGLATVIQIAIENLTGQTSFLSSMRNWDTRGLLGF